MVLTACRWLSSASCTFCTAALMMMIMHCPQCLEPADCKKHTLGVLSWACMPALSHPTTHMAWVLQYNCLYPLCWCRDGG